MGQAESTNSTESTMDHASLPAEQYAEQVAKEVERLRKLDAATLSQTLTPEQLALFAQHQASLSMDTQNRAVQHSVMAPQAVAHAITPSMQVEAPEQLALNLQSRGPGHRRARSAPASLDAIQQQLKQEFAAAQNMALATKKRVREVQQIESNVAALSLEATQAPPAPAPQAAVTVAEEPKPVPTPSKARPQKHRRVSSDSQATMAAFKASQAAAMLQQSTGADSPTNSSSSSTAAPTGSGTWKRAQGARPDAYKCRKCGLPKKNHVCSIPDDPTENEKTDAQKVLVWTPEEDQAIFASVQRLGPRWSLIAAELPGRTDNAVRNRWHRLEKAHKQRLEQGDDIGYRCRRCGLPKKGHTCFGLSSNNNAAAADTGAASGVDALDLELAQPSELAPRGRSVSAPPASTAHAAVVVQPPAPEPAAPTADLISITELEAMLLPEPAKMLLPEVPELSEEMAEQLAFALETEAEPQPQPQPSFNPQSIEPVPEEHDSFDIKELASLAHDNFYDQPLLTKPPVDLPPEKAYYQDLPVVTQAHMDAIITGFLAAH